MKDNEQFYKPSRIFFDIFYSDFRDGVRITSELIYGHQKAPEEIINCSKK